jgi:23S rRNA (adenine2030-N6)-methyltransferase
VKYEHRHHAGNFADVHKHVTLVAALDLLKRKEKGFLAIDTHAGHGAYGLGSRLGDSSSEAAGGIGRLLGSGAPTAPEIRAYLGLIGRRPREYGGSPLLIARTLRPQDRGVCIESQPAAHAALLRALRAFPRVSAEHGDGFARLPALLPPPERRALALLDPPYEQSREDFQRVIACVSEALTRFASCVILAWYPIKQQRDATRWQHRLSQALSTRVLHSTLWIWPRDSRVGLNGSGIAIVNAPYLLDERMRAWLPELHAALDPLGRGGWEIDWRQ